MRLVDQQSGLEILDREECLRMLAGHQRSVGRLAFVERSHPMVLPVNYALVEDRVVFRTAAGLKLDSSIRTGTVAFEIDDVDIEARTGWSVVVRGRCELVQARSQLAALQTTGLSPWAPGDKANWVMIHPETITGRRVPAAMGFFW